MELKKLLKIAKPIPFNAEMVKAILDGYKVQTRRVVNIDSDAILKSDDCMKISPIEPKGFATFEIAGKIKTVAPRYGVGDILWVREPAKVIKYNPVKNIAYVQYLSDGYKCKFNVQEYYKDIEIPTWISMEKGVPNGCTKFMARIFLKVTKVRVERLQDITNEDAEKEGIEHIKFNDGLYDLYGINIDSFDAKYISNINFIDSFKQMWNNLSPIEFNKWEKNPYVFVYEFEVMK